MKALLAFLCFVVCGLDLVANDYLQKRSENYEGGRSLLKKQLMLEPKMVESEKWQSAKDGYSHIKLSTAESIRRINLALVTVDFLKQESDEMVELMQKIEEEFPDDEELKLDIAGRAPAFIGASKAAVRIKQTLEGHLLYFEAANEFASDAEEFFDLVPSVQQSEFNASAIKRSRNLLERVQRRQAAIREIGKMLK